MMRCKRLHLCTISTISAIGLVPAIGASPCTERAIGSKRLRVSLGQRRAKVARPNEAMVPSPMSVAARLLRATFRAGLTLYPGEKPVSAVVTRRRARVTYLTGVLQLARLPLPTEQSPAPPVDPPAGPADLPAAESAIVEVLRQAEAPLKARAIAARCGLSYRGSHFKQAIARLLRAGTIIRPDPLAHLYWLPDRPMP